MEIDRRSLLRAGAGAAVGGLVGLRATGVAFAAQGSRPSLTLAGFQRYVNTSFIFSVGRQSVTMPLSKVTNERLATAKGPGESFSLLFAGPASAFGQGTYPVQHDAFGKFSMFVVPVGRRADGQDYQAVFNQVTG